LDTDFIKKILKVFKDFACLKGGQFDIIYLNELAKFPKRNSSVVKAEVYGKK